MSEYIYNAFKLNNGFHELLLENPSYSHNKQHYSKLIPDKCQLRLYISINCKQKPIILI